MMSSCLFCGFSWTNIHQRNHTVKQVRFELDSETQDPTDVAEYQQRETNKLIEELLLGGCWSEGPGQWTESTVKGNAVPMDQNDKRWRKYKARQDRLEDMDEMDGISLCQKWWATQYHSDKLPDLMKMHRWCFDQFAVGSVFASGSKTNNQERQGTTRTPGQTNRLPGCCNKYGNLQYSCTIWRTSAWSTSKACLNLAEPPHFPWTHPALEQWND